MAYRILLIDDEDDILEFVKYNLARDGYEVFTASNGAEGLQVALKVKPHLILLDMMMPVLDGIETCKALRNSPSLKNVMIVFLSAVGTEETQLQGYDAGADDYINKPIKMNILRSRVQAILKRIAPIDESSKPKIKIDREHYQVLKGDETIILPRKEIACNFASKAVVSAKISPYNIPIYINDGLPEHPLKNKTCAFNWLVAKLKVDIIPTFFSAL